MGSEFQINTHTTSGQVHPAVAVDADGDFVVVWQSLGQDGSSYGVFGLRYDSGGMAQGGEFQVNTYTTSSQFGPAVAADADGDFVVAWESSGQDGSTFGIFGQRFQSIVPPPIPTTSRAAAALLAILLGLTLAWAVRRRATAP